MAALDLFDLEGTTIEGKFRVIRAVAAGGFGVVYKGSQTSLNRDVAIKVLKPLREYGEEVRQTFFRAFQAEAEIIAGIRHPGIVQVIDFGIVTLPNSAETPWIALEWITGEPFAKELLRRLGSGGRSPAQCFALLLPVFKAVALAHRKGIAHRDIKPANIMRDTADEEAPVKLLDFGIAKIMEDGHVAGSGDTATEGELAAFSPRYAAPEQISHTRTGPWTDVHALGLILTEVLTDEYAYRGDDRSAWYTEAFAPVRPTPARHNVDVGAWEPVIARALALRPDERFSNAGEFLSALEAALPHATRHHPEPKPSVFDPPPLASQAALEAPPQAFVSSDHPRIPATSSWRSWYVGAPLIIALFMLIGYGAARVAPRPSPVNPASPSNRDRLPAPPAQTSVAPPSDDRRDAQPVTLPVVSGSPPSSDIRPPSKRTGAGTYSGRRRYPIP